MSSKTEVRFWYPSRKYLAHKSEFDSEIQRVLSSGDLILREDVHLFEKNLAEFLGVKHVVSVASGTDALILSLRATNVGILDEVLCPSYTFRATIEAIHHVGAKPVLYDLDGRFEHLVTKRTAAILPAHLEGAVRDDMQYVTNFCQGNGLVLIEDSCQAIGASPLFGTTACYSFYPAKILGCFGDGGAIATDNTHLAAHLLKMRNHYKGDWKAGYGYNSRLDNVQAAILNVKLRYLNDDLKRRKQIATMYDNNLFGVGIPEVREVYQDYIIVFPNVLGLHEHLEKNGVETAFNHYPFPGDLEKGSLAKGYEYNSLRIPCSPEHTDEEIHYVIEKINEYVLKG